MNRTELKIRLGAIALPDPRNIKDPTPFYEPILVKMGVTTMAEIDELREIIGENIIAMQEEVVIQNTRDIAAGKKLEDMPLYREETAEGVTIRNIPDELLKWYGFIAWLNDRHIGAQ